MPLTCSWSAGWRSLRLVCCEVVASGAGWCPQQDGTEVFYQCIRPKNKASNGSKDPPRFEDAAWANWGDGGKHRETKWQAVTHVCIFLHGALANPWVIWLPTFAGHGAMVLVFFQRGQWNCTKLKMLKCWKMRRHEVPAESQASLALEREPLSQDKHTPPALADPFAPPQTIGIYHYLIYLSYFCHIVWNHLGPFPEISYWGHP